MELSGMKNGHVTDGSVVAAEDRPAALPTQLYLLLSRKLLILRRNPGSVLIRALAHIAIGALFGYLYGGVGDSASTVLANYCYLYGSNLFLVYTGKMSVTLLFPIEMWTVTREHFNRWYKLGPYYLSMVLVEIPFQVLCCYLYLPVSYLLTQQPMDWFRFWHFSISATAASLTAQSFGFLLGVTTPRKIAVFLGPVVACLLSVFGFCLRFGDTPYEFRWLYYISYFRAAFQSCVYSMYGFERSILKCPEVEGQDFQYCHFRFPKKFLTEMDMPGEIDVHFNLNFILVWGMLLHVLTIAVVWYKLNRK